MKAFAEAASLLLSLPTVMKKLGRIFSTSVLKAALLDFPPNISSVTADAIGVYIVSVLAELCAWHHSQFVGGCVGVAEIYEQQQHVGIRC